jgi:tetratricopeptide (TPR) repeat protein
MAGSDDIPIFYSLLVQFNQRLFADDFAAARGLLQRMSEHPEATECHVVAWTAAILFREGETDEALAMLDQAIRQNWRDKWICHRERADELVRLSRYREAISDYDAVLADKTPLVVERIHIPARFKKAYALARLGDPEFERVIVELPDDGIDRVAGEFVDVAALKRLYAQIRPRRRN